jgi:translation initiation factor IF-2
MIFSGKVASLHRFKEDVKKVAAGYECGIRVENYQDIDKGDILEIYEIKEVKAD